MLVDSALSPSPFYNPNNADYSPADLQDFLNIDLFGKPSSSSRASSHSPPPSDTLATPPQPFVDNVDAFAAAAAAASASSSFSSDFFNFSTPFPDDFVAKAQQQQHDLPPLSVAPFDFLAAFNASANASPQFAIDPQLVHTPASSTPEDPSMNATLMASTSTTTTTTQQSSPSDETRSHEGDDEAESRTYSPEVESPLSPEDAAPAIKAGGKGHGGRRGTVQSGAIAKKPALSAVVKVRSPTAGDADRDEDDMDDWRPSPEEYKKMSSKEKRQLRNKISARNFRVRRKEYITTLEGDIAERDRLIDAIRSELGSTKSENAALREEISALKKVLLTAADAPVLPPPGPLPSAPTSTPPVSANPTTKSALLTANTLKDLPSSPGLGNKAFWGGAASSAFGGVTPVHTTIIPDLAARLQENINPALNVPAPSPAQAQAPTHQQQQHHQYGFGGVGGGRTGPFDAFADSNPFTMKMLDAYRMQLWTRMAQQTRAQQQQQQQQQPAQQQQQQQPLSGLAANMRPAFFSAPKSKPSPALSSFLSGKHTSTSPSSSYPSPPPTPHLSPKPIPSSSRLQSASDKQRSAEVLAAMAQQTLFQRLGGAFWDAFAGSGPNSGAGAGKNVSVDADKVRRVLEGTAVVRVVDVDEGVSASQGLGAKVPASPRLAPASPRLAPPSPRLAPSSPRMAPSSPRLAPATPRACASSAREDCVSSLQSALEESMRALSLGKK